MLFHWTASSRACQELSSPGCDCWHSQLKKRRKKNLWDKVFTMNSSINQSLTLCFSRPSQSHVISAEKNVKWEATLNRQRPTVPALPQFATSPIWGFSDQHFQWSWDTNNSFEGYSISHTPFLQKPLSRSILSSFSTPVPGEEEGLFCFLRYFSGAELLLVFPS